MKLKLIKYPTPSLFDPSKPVTDFMQAGILIEKMLELIPSLWGEPMGLAAPQVGHNIRLFLMRTERGLYKAYINPEIINRSKQITFHEEGCYSLEKDVFEPNLERSASVWIKYQDLTGQWQEEKLNGMKARVFQHEFDHLEGVLCHNP